MGNCCVFLEKYIRMDTINLPYRSTSHLPLLYVIEESGAWENHGSKLTTISGSATGTPEKRSETAISFFPTNPEEAADVIRENYTADGELDHEAAAHVQRELSKVQSPNLFPMLDGIRNAYQEAVWSNKGALKVEPLELWDFHHLRKIQAKALRSDRKCKLYYHPTTPG